MNIPLIIPNYNQLTYLKNLINWWKFYYPNNPVYIVDNNSNYKPLLEFYDKRFSEWNDINVLYHTQNDCRKNLAAAVEYVASKYEYYVISDPDIMPCPNTPPNFLEIFKKIIDSPNVHHVGFGLKIDDIPEWYSMRQEVINNETGFKQVPSTFFHIDGVKYETKQAPIDTTFALYKKSNGGWASPMTPFAWTQSFRIFEAYHLGWYLDGSNLNPEMYNYFHSAKKFVPGEPSAGSNNYRPAYKPVQNKNEVISYNADEMVNAVEDFKGVERMTSDMIIVGYASGAILNEEFPGFKEDYLVLHCLLRKFKPSTVFEIGTNMGTGTKIIKNAVMNALVYSLDLPTELADKSLQHPISEGKGDRVGAHCKLPFIQLRGDSMTFDFSHYPCEAYFVDGEHDYDHPYRETIEILKNKPKLIIYHDSDIPAVYKAITDAFTGNNEYDLVRVTDTRIFFALKK